MGLAKGPAWQRVSNVPTAGQVGHWQPRTQTLPVSCTNQQKQNIFPHDLWQNDPVEGHRSSHESVTDGWVMKPLFGHTWFIHPSPMAWRTKSIPLTPYEWVLLSAEEGKGTLTGKHHRCTWHSKFKALQGFPMSLDNRQTPYHAINILPTCTVSFLPVFSLTTCVRFNLSSMSQLPSSLCF